MALCRCFLCQRMCAVAAVTALTSFGIREHALQMLLQKFGNRSVPHLCGVCGRLLRRALQACVQVCNRPIAIHMLSSARAFAARDLGQHFSSVHSGVIFQKTCRWEPLLGRTAQKARNAVGRASPKRKLHALYRHYHVPTGRTKRIKRSKQTINTFEELMGQYSRFARPFVNLMLASSDCAPEVKARATQHLSQHWSTSYGGGRVINGLLFRGAHVVPESINDCWKKQSLSSFYRTTRANEVYGCILWGSDFGREILATSRLARNRGMADADASWWQQHQHLYDTPAAQLQRFLFKLCELRKVNVQGRSLWYGIWSEVGARLQWKQQYPNHVDAFWPGPNRRGQMQLPTFATVAWNAAGVQEAMACRREILVSLGLCPDAPLKHVPSELQDSFVEVVCLVNQGQLVFLFMSPQE